MRVVAGEFKSRRLKTLPGLRTRPTSDKLRETLFNLIGDAVADAVFADCYAGSGAVGIEARSRGARRVYFLEANPAAVQVIRCNLKALEIEEDSVVLAMNVSNALKKLANRGIKFNIAFLDPPYEAAAEYDRALGWFGRGTLLAAEGLVIAEHDKRHVLGGTYGALHLVRTRTQGDAALSFFRAT